MSTATETTTRERVRVYATGSCEGFDKLRESLGATPTSNSSAGAPPSLTLPESWQAVTSTAILHATRAASLPTDELAAIREHTRLR